MLASRRPWLAGIAALVLVLVGVTAGAHVASWRSAPTARASVSSGFATTTHAARADVPVAQGHASAPQQLDATTPPADGFAPVVADTDPADVTLREGRSVDAPVVHPGRAPPTV